MLTAQCPTAIRRNFKTVLLIIVLIALAGCDREASPQIEFVLGTVCRINLYEGGTRQLYSRIFARIREVDRTMTVYPGNFRTWSAAGK